MNSARRTTAATATAVVLATAGGLLSTVTPASAAVSCTSPVFKRQFFANTTFSGTPKKTDCDTTIDQNWSGAPASGLPSNNFGVRWTVTRDFGSGGPFALTASALDGIRVYVDGVRKIDLWRNVSSTVTKTVNLTIPSGKHSIRVDYVNWTGSASVKFNYTPRTSATVDKVKPLTPTGTSLSYDQATGKAKLTWAKNKEMDLAGYKVYRRLKGTSFGSAPLKTTTSTSYTDSTIPKSGEQYLYEVRAYDKAGNVSAGTPDKAVTTVDATPPATPSGMTVSRLDASVRIAWQPVAGEVTYRVYRSTSPEGPFSEVSDWIPGTSFEDKPSYALYKTWYYRVTARDTVGNESAPTAIGTTDDIDLDPPAPVSTVQASGTTAGNNVWWHASTDADTVKYQVWTRRLTEPEFTGPVIVTGTSWLDESAPVGSSVEYKVYPVDAAGNVALSSVSGRAIRPAAASIPAPSAVTAKPLDSATRVTWKNPDAFVQGFRVYRRTAPDGGWTLLNDTLTTAPTFDDTTAPKGYASYYVAAVNGEGDDSLPSAPATVDRLTPATATAPLAPGLALSAPYTECTANDCAAHGGTGQPFTVTMSRPAGDDRRIGGYRWHVMAFGDESGYPTTTDTSFTWTPATHGQYRVEVATVDVYGRVGPSSTLIFKVS
ncbi:PA14 domain-containing protein [Streptomyces sp. 4N124]|uniref:PA14 domain-containing protein n=1 Tax=Streptomyces sp. 4N124 TaxID=3457420 RepID=UPI003FD6B139